MYQNCGRGSKIAILDWKSLSLKEIKGQQSVNFKTLSHYVERLKTEGKCNVVSIIQHYVVLIMMMMTI